VFEKSLQTVDSKGKALFFETKESAKLEKNKPPYFAAASLNNVKCIAYEGSGWLWVHGIATRSSKNAARIWASESMKESEREIVGK
jgi:hypothetical protein